MVVQIYFDNGELRFFNSDDRLHPEWGNAIPLEIAQTSDGPDNRNVLVRLTIGGFEDLFIVDTGFDGSGNIPTDGFDSILRAAPRLVARRYAFTIKGVATGRYIRTPDFVLGD